MLWPLCMTEAGVRNCLRPLALLHLYIHFHAYIYECTLSSGRNIPAGALSLPSRETGTFPARDVRMRGRGRVGRPHFFLFSPQIRCLDAPGFPVQVVQFRKEAAQNVHLCAALSSSKGRPSITSWEQSTAPPAAKRAPDRATEGSPAGAWEPAPAPAWPSARRVGSPWRRISDLACQQRATTYSHTLFGAASYRGSMTARRTYILITTLLAVHVWNGTFGRRHTGLKNIDRHR